MARRRTVRRDRASHDRIQPLASNPSTAPRPLLAGAVGCRSWSAQSGELALEKAALALVPGKPYRELELTTRLVAPTEAPEQFAADTRQQVGAGEAVRGNQVVDDVQRRCRALGHGDRDRPVELYDGRGRQPAERLVEQHYPVPVRLVDGRCDRMTLGDTGLDAVRTETTSDPSGPDQGRTPTPDCRPVPPPTVLLLQQHRFAVVTHARREPGGGELEEREQSVRLRLVRHQPRQHPGQPDRLTSQVRPDPIGA